MLYGAVCEDMCTTSSSAFLCPDRAFARVRTVTAVAVAGPATLGELVLVELSSSVATKQLHSGRSRVGDVVRRGGALA